MRLEFATKARRHLHHRFRRAAALHRHHPLLRGDILVRLDVQRGDDAGERRAQHAIVEPLAGGLQGGLGNLELGLTLFVDGP